MSSRHQGPMQALIRDALNAKQTEPATWDKISPEEALAVRQSYYAAEKLIEQLKQALAPFALISSEGVVKSETGHVTVTTCAEYFHNAATALSKATA